MNKVYLIDNRLGSLISTYPVVSSSNHVDLIRLYAILFNTSFSLSDFKVSSEWSPTCIGHTTITGIDRSHTKYQAIAKVCDDLSIPIDAKEKLDISMEPTLRYDKVTWVHFVSWKHYNVGLKRIRQSLWRDRSELSPSDFYVVAKRTGDGYVDPCMWEFDRTDDGGDGWINVYLHKISSELGKDGIVPSLNLSGWRGQHPYFRHAAYDRRSGIPLLSTEEQAALPKHYKRAYTKIGSNQVTESECKSWKRELYLTISKQEQQFRDIGMDISFFTNLPEWSLPELIYFIAKPPPMLLTTQSQKRYTQVDGGVHRIIQHSLSSVIIFLTGKRSKSKQHPTIAVFTGDFIENVGISSKDLHQESKDAYFIVGPAQYIPFLNQISEKYGFPLSSLYAETTKKSAYYDKLMSIHEAIVLGNNTQPHASFLTDPGLIMKLW